MLSDISKGADTRVRRNLINVISTLPGGDRLLDQYRRLRASGQPNSKAHRGDVGGMWEEFALPEARA